MSDKLEEILKKIATDTSAENSQNLSSTDAYPAGQGQTLGEADCPHCGGLGLFTPGAPRWAPRFWPGVDLHLPEKSGQPASRSAVVCPQQPGRAAQPDLRDFQPRGQIGLGPRQANSLEQAFNHAQQFSQSLEGWLLLQGGYGGGKTHLAAAIANFSVSLGIPTLFITVPDLLNSLRFAYQNPEYPLLKSGSKRSAGPRC